MKTNKSLLSVLIVLALCLALLPVSALATYGNIDPTTGGDQTYIPTATMTVYKTDDLGEPLAGAVIALMKEDGTTVYSKATTSTSGTVTFSGVVDGSYTLCEQSAPEGYIKSEKTYKIVVSNGSATLFNGRESYSYNRNPVTFVNLPDDACNVVVYKTDAEGEPLEGAVIALMVGSDLTTGGETIYAEQETDENGEALFSRLPDGSYTVVEEYAPDGYEKTDETFRLDVFEGEATLTINGVDGISPEDHPMVFVNGFADNSMDVAVTDGLGNPVPGAKVTITDEDGKDEETTTDRRGHAHFLNLPDGKYTIRVPEVPSPLVPPEREAAIIVDNGVIRLDDGAYAPPLVFVSYKEVALNKTDHFAFLKGYPDGTFGQSRNMTRAEVTVMFARLITEKMDADSTYKSTFSDVPADAWYAGYVGFMQQFGIIRGYSDGTFKPDAPISRAEFATIACRFDALTAGTATFSDVPADHWAAKYISFAADKGWVTGYTDGTFHPAANITRAEVAAVTCRLLERSADKGYVTANYDTLPRTYSDIADGNWAFWYAMESSNGHDYSKAADGAETWSKVYE